jgi:hypothetical protein
MRDGKDMSSLVKKAWIIQHNIEYNHKHHRMLKQRRYKIYLQNRGGYLPTLKTLVWWRKILVYTTGLCLTPYPLEIILCYPMMFKEDIIGITTIPGLTFLIMGSFTLILDYIIHKRWGDHVNTIIHW